MVKKSRSVTDFLAAPDATVSNERERKKLLQRKAQDEARLAREALGKSSDTPSQEDILADVVRVAEDPDCNPFHVHRSISQRRYELYGHYPIEEVLKLGQFQHVKQQCGLADSSGTQQLLLARTKNSKDQHAERYMRRYLLPHVNKFPELTRAAKGWKCGVSISDLHGLYLDPFTWEVFLDTIQEIAPDVVYFNGDVIDGLEISTHPKVPGSSVPLQLELDFTRELFKEVRTRVPGGTRVVWGAGNHFLDRMTRYLTQVAPGFAGLRALRIDQLVGLEDLEIELAQGGSFISPAGTESDKPQRLLWGHYLVTHGTRLGEYPAAAELRSWGVSGTSGHVHRSSVHFGSTHAHRGMTWMSTPMSCIEDAGKWYVKGNIPWQKGWGVFMVSPKGRVQHYPVITDGGVAHVEGHIYEARKGLPTTDKTVRKFWLKRFGLNWGDYF